MRVHYYPFPIPPKHRLKIVGFGPSNINIGLKYIGLYWMILDDIGLIGLKSNTMSNKSNIDIGRVIGLDIGFQFQTLDIGPPNIAILESNILDILEVVVRLSCE